MSLNRLKRQDFHTCMCAAALFVFWTAVFFVSGLPAWEIAVFLISAAAAGALTGAFDTAIRTRRELAVRLLCACTLAFAVTAAMFGHLTAASALYAEAVLAGGIWIIITKLWLRRELCPGWTLLVYDSEDNLAKAERLAQSYSDLILETGRIPWTDADEIARTVEIFRVPQMVICLEGGGKELLDYCRKNGITAFVSGNPEEKGYRLGRHGMYYVRPVPPVWKKRFHRKNGALEG